MKSNRGRNVTLIFYLIIIATVLVLLNWFYDRNLMYGAYRTDLIKSLVEDIERGIIPDFLGISIHSWAFTLYLPYLAHFLGINDINLMFLGIQMVSAWALLILFPLEIYFITKDRLLTYFSPILLHIFCGNALYGFKTQTYWPAGYAVILCIPLLYIIYNTQKALFRIMWIAVLGLACSMANIMRNQNGFPILAACVFIIVIYFLCNERNLKGVILLAIETIVLFFTYYLICTIIPYLIGQLTHSTVLDNEGFVWHSILCGLGLFENPYGFKWSDEVIGNLINERYGFRPYSNDYIISCRNYFFEIFINDPVFVLSTWMKKFFMCLGRTLQMLFAHKGSFGPNDGEFYYYSTGIFNIRNILIPTVTSIIYAVIKQKRLIAAFVIEKKQVFIMWTAYLIIILSGTIQGVIGYSYSIQYYMGTVTAVAGVPLFAMLFLIGNRNKNKR